MLKQAFLSGSSIREYIDFSSGVVEGGSVEMPLLGIRLARYEYPFFAIGYKSGSQANNKTFVHYNEGYKFGVPTMRRSSGDFDLYVIPQTRSRFGRLFLEVAGFEADESPEGYFAAKKLTGKGEINSVCLRNLNPSLTFIVRPGHPIIKFVFEVETENAEEPHNQQLFVKDEVFVPRRSDSLVDMRHVDKSSFLRYFDKVHIGAVQADSEMPLLAVSEGNVSMPSDKMGIIEFINGLDLNSHTINPNYNDELVLEMFASEDIINRIKNREPLCEVVGYSLV